MSVGRTRHRDLAPFGDRLRAAITAHPRIRNRSEFVQLARIQPVVLYRYETGDQSPRLEDVERWAELLGVAPAWLAYGSVDPEATPGEQDDDVLWAAEQCALEAQETRRLRQVRALLGPMSRAELLSAAEALVRRRS